MRKKIDEARLIPEDPDMWKEVARGAKFTLWERLTKGRKLKDKGLHHFTRNMFGHRVEYLVFYKDRKLVGVAQYMPEDIPFADLPRFRIPPGCYSLLAEKSGNINLVVHPAHQRKGIGTMLLKEADSRWGIDLGQQVCTPSGKALIDSYSGKTTG